MHNNVCLQTPPPKKKKKTQQQQQTNTVRTPSKFLEVWPRVQHCQTFRNLFWGFLFVVLLLLYVAQCDPGQTYVVGTKLFSDRKIAENY